MPICWPQKKGKKTEKFSSRKIDENLRRKATKVVKKLSIFYA